MCVLFVCHDISLDASLLTLHFFALLNLVIRQKTTMYIIGTLTVTTANTQCYGIVVRTLCSLYVTHIITVSIVGALILIFNSSSITYITLDVLV